MSATTHGWSLGLRADTPADAIARVERGLSPAAADRLADRLGLSPAQLARAAGASPRTLARRRRAGRLAPAESDRLYRLARLFERAVEAFGGDDDDRKAAEEDAKRWFHLPQWALGEATPLDYAHTDPGAREVEALLDRIDHGVLA
jgi:putative toxin-antitoxin system antitoxin component (TIGR02293 family)